MRIALGLEYQGKAYAGWQRQPELATVQRALEAAVSTIACTQTVVHVAGRTDAGVHATAQVAHFDCDATRPITAWVRGVNSHLPKDVAVLWAKPVPDHFHARFSAMRRRYRYRLLCHPIRPAILNGQVGWIHRDLDVAAMQAAAPLLLGEHDFSAFRSSECQAKTPVKTLYEIQLIEAGDILEFTLVANAFLHHMVRNLVGAFIHIGVGNAPSTWLKVLLESRDRRLGAPMVEAAGLYLDGIQYPPEFDLPSWDTPSRLFW